MAETQSQSSSSMVDLPSEFSASSASSPSSGAYSNEAVLYTSSPAVLDRRTSLPPFYAEPHLRGPSARSGLPRISPDALLQHTWGHPFDDAIFQLGRTMWERFPQFEQPSSEVIRIQNLLPNNPVPRRPVIVDGSTGWRDRQRLRSTTNVGHSWLLEGMRRLHEEELRLLEEHSHVLEARLRIADARLLHITNLLQQGIAADEPNTQIMPPMPSRNMSVNMEFRLRVVAEILRDSIANGRPQHIRQRSIQVRRQPNQVREERQEERRNQAGEEPGADPFEHVNPFHRGRNLPRWTTYSNFFES